MNIATYREQRTCDERPGGGQSIAVLTGFTLLILGGFLPPWAMALDLPLRPSEANIMHQIVATEQLDVRLAEMPGWAKNGLLRSLESYGVDTASFHAAGIAVKDKPSMFLGFVYDAEGRVLALSGNGPWLRNSSLRSLKGLPELRIIRIDHNGFVGRDPRIPEFDGSGFDALVSSKLSEIKIGLSFSDAGMERCAEIKSLRSFAVAHSRATESGIDYFAGHAGLTSFSIAEMASDRVTGQALGAIAKIPHLTHVGFKECFVTYDGGFVLLAPLKGQLEEIDLTMSVASQADLEKLQTDHPQARVLTIAPAEIVKRHKFIAAKLAKQAPPELAVPLNAALEQVEK
ncbi:MAG: hypothetical protein EA381_01075 [Planctomycetaceae bacterium]|nr:MAG: hypothetical protein EA381_01075 [Planctomycetaceae bacterium]